MVVILELKDSQSAAFRNPFWEAVEVGRERLLPEMDKGVVAVREVDATGMGKVMVDCKPVEPKVIVPVALSTVIPPPPVSERTPMLVKALPVRFNPWLADKDVEATGKGKDKVF